MVAALTRIFGVQNLALAEDVVQDAFCRALEVWKYRGVPDNPQAWLMATAKNRALDAIRRERTGRRYAPELARTFASEWTLKPALNEMFADHAIKDDQLRMMFSCCQPSLSEPAQIALILNLLCGFTAGEIAGVFFSTASAVEKRISRAKHALATSDGLFELSDAGVAARLPVVQRALYQLFSEGYHGGGETSAVRVHLAREAMRLVALLHEHPLAATPATCALYALMCLHAARMPARLNGAGNLMPLGDQDRTRFDAKLIARGQRLLEEAATGTELSEYHVEAAIAWIHAQATPPSDAGWKSIVECYDLLMRMRPSPLLALNRAIAVAQLEGPQSGLQAIDAMSGRDTLARYPFFFAAIAEMHVRSGRLDLARDNFATALDLARNPSERDFFERRLSQVGELRPSTRSG
jgi:RNA polymerase sigma-70 factor (ECF subfamily)